MFNTYFPLSSSGAPAPRFLCATHDPSCPVTFFCRSLESCLRTPFNCVKRLCMDTKHREDGIGELLTAMVGVAVALGAGIILWVCLLAVGEVLR